MFEVFVEGKGKAFVLQSVFTSERKDYTDQNKAFGWDVKGTLVNGRVELLKMYPTKEEAEKVVKSIFMADKVTI